MMTIGPNSSGRSDARLIGAQPAWQPITQGLRGRRAGRRRRRIASATASGGITRASAQLTGLSSVRRSTTSSAS
ncbi:hypothetical protein CDO27_26470 (plasmid) [Sinorhizobium meliloti]|nr:hypothetical protein CDO29_22850 [Sinorhizobium meliloti]ASP81328.1 hypothetical protein CDO27_26470 [Sinorhizobium meliloti]